MAIATTYSKVRVLLLLAVLFCFSSLHAAPRNFTVSPSADGKLNFYSSVGVPTSQAITITNTSANVLTLHVALRADSAGFTMSGIGNTVALLPQSSAQVYVMFTPTRSGNYEGRLTISDSTDQVVYSLQGITNSSAGGSLQVGNELNFENVAAGTQSCKDLSIRNTTGLLLHLQATSFTGDTSQFQLGSMMNGGFNVLANKDSSLNICYVPTANSTNANAVLTLSYKGVTDTSYSGTVQVRLKGDARATLNHDSSLTYDRLIHFDNLTIGQQQCQNLSLRNSTNVAITIDNVSFKGDTAGFMTQMAIGSSIGAHTTSMITVCYTPSATGSTNTTLTLAYHSPNDSTIRGNLYVSILGEVEREDSDHTNGNCIVVRHAGGVFGPIVNGGSINDSVMLVNKTNAAITINSATLNGSDAGAFTVTSTFPLTLAANGTTGLAFRFAPMDSAHVRYSSDVTLNLSGGANCTTTTFQIGGVAVPGNHKGGINLDSTVEDIIGVQGNSGSTTSTTLTFTNNTSTPITVIGVSLQDSTNFNVISTSPTLPVTLMPGAQLNVVVGLNGNVPGLFTTGLNIQTANSVTPRTIILQGIVPQPLDIVLGTTPASASVMVSPNPTNGPIRVDLANVSRAKIEIFDVLGHLLASGNSTTNWTWSGSTFGALANGSYIVRITGSDRAGKDFMISRHVAVQH